MESAKTKKTNTAKTAHAAAPATHTPKKSRSALLYINDPMTTPRAVFVPEAGAKPNDRHRQGMIESGYYDLTETMASFKKSPAAR
jgi:hypothetical protein